jgi:beta-lactamase class A
MITTRRDILIGGAVLGVGAPMDSRSLAWAQDATIRDEPRIAGLVARIGGRVGVAALNTGSRVWIAHRQHERFAMCSTFKWLVAAAVLEKSQRGEGSLGDHVRLDENDLLEYAPVARRNLARGWMSIEELCAAAVEVSDNTAGNLLLETVMGPKGLTNFIRSTGDGITRLDRNEPELNENLPGDERDTTTPDAMARLLQKILTTPDVLTEPLREKLIGWMVACKTGKSRLRAGLPQNWRVGDKTGAALNALNAASNDVAIAWPANGNAPIVIASYLSDGPSDAAVRDAAHAEIGRIVADALS